MGTHRRRKFPRSNSLNSLSPFCDEKNKVIRVGGRLADSPHTIDRKFPVLIPRKSPITEMLIREAHEKTLHGGPQLTLYTLRRATWIPGGLFVVKGVLYRCKPCIRFDAKLLQPQMVDLPREQVVSAVICVQSLRTRLLWTVLHKKWNSNAFENIRCNFHLFKYEGSSHRASYVSDQGRLSCSH